MYMKQSLYLHGCEFNLKRIELHENPKSISNKHHIKLSNGSVNMTPRNINLLNVYNIQINLHGDNIQQVKTEIGR